MGRHHVLPGRLTRGRLRRQRRRRSLRVGRPQAAGRDRGISTRTLRSPRPPPSPTRWSTSAVTAAVSTRWTPGPAGRDGSSRPAARSRQRRRSRAVWPTSAPRTTSALQVHSAPAVIISTRSTCGAGGRDRSPIRTAWSRPPPSQAAPLTSAAVAAPSTPWTCGMAWRGGGSGPGQAALGSDPRQSSRARWSISAAVRRTALCMLWTPEAAGGSRAFPAGGEIDESPTISDGVIFFVAGDLDASDSPFSCLTAVK